ncbi:hypothetical protein [Chelativorans sp.]|uniref:hypothetical protein n=1 Tax=Chelativorans sp. TaxID=2203393 RepID=UPI002811F443|nr:hypothetical protein [Chelativorans sp.]
MRALLQAVLRLFIFPGDWVADRLGVAQEENRDLVRMLINGFVWMVVVIIGLAIWTSTLPIYE